VRAVRNIAIIALLALVVAAVPGGGNLADGILAVLSLLFLALIGVTGYMLYRQNRLAYLTLDERGRTVLLAALGAIVLMIAGTDELLGSGAGTLVWIGVLGLSIFAIVQTVQSSRAL
jgi:hypothetical protein